jgi:KipI family sensor histidine kinase inhibitor
VSKYRRPKIVPLGDSALLIQLGDEIDLAINRRIHALDAQLNANHLAGVIETVPAYASLLVHYDPLALTFAQALDWVEETMTEAESMVTRKPRLIEVPVRYGGEAGPDLDFVASDHHISAREVVRIHTSREYIVYMMGFTPGFPYMGKLDNAIATPRLETPRTRVIAGSVGVAGEQTGIYPIDSPGGWRLIGRTSLQLFDLATEPPFLFSPGDMVQFVVEALDA